MKLAATVLFAGLLSACAPTVECVHGDFLRAECRVQAENEFAHFQSSDGVEIRFQEAESTEHAGWESLGLIENGFGGLRLRPAGLGDFAISFDAVDLGLDSIEITLDNVAFDMVLTREVGPNITVISDPNTTPATSLRRQVSLQLDNSDLTWLRAKRPACPTRYRLAAMGDIQTNPLQFRRILDHMKQAESEADTPLLGLILLGDLSESSDENEMRWIDELMRGSKVPVSVTTGNHDVYASDMGLFNRIFGPGNYNYSVCGATVALFDTGNAGLADSVRGRMGELLQHKQHEDGSQDQYLLAAMHYPMHVGHTAGGWTEDLHRFELSVEAVRKGLDLALAGHVHYWHHFPDVPVGDGSFNQVISGTAGGHQGDGGPQQFGYTRINIDTSANGTLDYCFVQVAEPGNVNPTKLDSIPYCE